ncbi:MAG TPA: cytochrome D1 domain-containing protein [Pseudolabrys sp.]|nr:cytochrome D1 domain-containing protein [Pseudolabrys sp.]
MSGDASARGMIAVDKIGTKILFLNPRTYVIESILDGFQKTVHELLVIPETGRAYVPIFGDGIHGRNPNPGHTLLVIDCLARKHIATIDLAPLSAPHTLRLGADGLIYITCENSAKVAVIDPKTNKVIDTIDSGSTNGHRLAIPDDGRRLYTDNEEDATVSVIDVPNRKLLGKIATPEKLAGIAVSGDGKTVIAVSDDSPVVFAIDTAAGKVVRTVPLEGVEKAAQIARYSPNGKLLVVSSLNSNKISIMDAATFGNQSAIAVGSQPMDFAFRNGELFVGCQGDGTMHIIDIAGRRNKTHVRAGSGCESIGFF